MLQDTRIAFIGSGAMAGAMIAGLLAQELTSRKILLLPALAPKERRS